MNKKRVVPLLTVVLAFALTGAADAQVQEGFPAADAASLGVVVEDDRLTETYCLADAGSLGVPDPVGACAGIGR